MTEDSFLGKLSLSGCLKEIS